MGSCRNYNPVERRSKGGRERSVKGSNKMPKSLQTNNTPPNSSSVGLTKASGLHDRQKCRFFILTITILLCIFLNIVGVITLRAQASKYSSSAGFVEGGILPQILSLYDKEALLQMLYVTIFYCMFMSNWNFIFLFLLYSLLISSSLTITWEKKETFTSPSSGMLSYFAKLLNSRIFR